MSLKIESPFAYFPGSDGLPLDNGAIYIGKANLNPETNPIAVYFDEALTIPAGQPVRTSGGHPVRNGTPAQIYTSADDFSITIRDSAGSVVVSAQSATSLQNLAADLAASTGSSLVGHIGAGSGAVKTTAQAKLRTVINLKEDYGLALDGVTDDLAKLQLAVDDAGLLGVPIECGKGQCRINGTLNITKRVAMRADPGAFELVQGTQNAPHIKIGDGTAPARSATINTVIDGITFTPFSGVTAFASGACIEAEYVAFLNIKNCDFYGKDGVGNKLNHGIELDRVEDSWITDCRARFLKGSPLYAYGAAGLANRTVDVVIHKFRTAACDSDHIYYGPHSSGMFLTDWVSIGIAAGKSGLLINADPATEQGTNYFIVNPNIEGGNAASSNGIRVSKGQNVDILGGWIGGLAPNTCSTVWIESPVSACKLTGTRLDSPNLRIDAPAVTLTGLDITGDNSTMNTAILIGSGANDTVITGGRIRQFVSSGIAITGTPARVNINGVGFANIAADNFISGANYTTGPTITGISAPTSSAITAAATIAVNYGRTVYQVTGATVISNIGLMASGYEVTIQAGVGGITFNNAGNIVLRGAAASSVIAAFSGTQFVCSGAEWYQI